jgi:hypothetical protein
MMQECTVTYTNGDTYTVSDNRVMLLLMLQ